MNEDRRQDCRARIAEAQATLNATQGVWPYICNELQRERLAKMERLVVAEDPELRGRIKQIDDLLQMPQYLRREIENLSGALPDSGASE